MKKKFSMINSQIRTQTVWTLRVRTEEAVFMSTKPTTQNVFVAITSMASFVKVRQNS